METIRSIKRNIREGIEEIKSNKLKDISDYQSLDRWTAWVNKDVNKLIKLKQSEEGKARHSSQA